MELGDWEASLEGKFDALDALAPAEADAFGAFPFAAADNWVPRRRSTWTPPTGGTSGTGGTSLVVRRRWSSGGRASRPAWLPPADSRGCRAHAPAAHGPGNPPPEASGAAPAVPWCPASAASAAGRWVRRQQQQWAVRRQRSVGREALREGCGQGQQSPPEVARCASRPNAPHSMSPSFCSKLSEWLCQLFLA